MVSVKPNSEGRSPIFKQIRRIGVVILVTLAIAFNASLSVKPDTVNADARQHLTMAYNLFKYGVLSGDLSDRPTVQPTYRREPLYPLLLAGVLKATTPPSKRFNLLCLLNGRPACKSIQVRLQYFNIGLLLATVLATFLAGRALIGGAIAPAIAAVLVGLSPALVDAVQSFYTEIPAALALLLTSTGLYLTVTRPRWMGAAITAGIALGALMLIKAVFFYFGMILAIALVSIALVRRSRQPVKAGLTVLLVAYAIAGIWISRNAIEFGTPAISGRGGEVLAIRAEFSTMTWREYGASFLAHTPEYGQPLLKRFFAPQDYERFDRDNPNGFYRRAKNRAIELRDSNDPYADIDEQLNAEAKDLIRHHWLKHIALTIPFAYQGAYIKLLPENRLVPTEQCEEPDACTVAKWLLVPTRLLYSLSFLVALVWAWRHQQIGILLFLLPSLYSIGIHAVATHYIPRYSEPLIPCLAIALALAGLLIGEKWRSRPSKVLER